jgi:hypothetical protein
MVYYVKLKLFAIFMAFWRPIVAKASIISKQAGIFLSTITLSSGNHLLSTN